MVGYWAYTVSEYGIDPKPDFDPDLLGAFLITAILVVPTAIVLGMFDAAALALPATEGTRRAADRPLRAGMDSAHRMGLASG